MNHGDYNLTRQKFAWQTQDQITKSLSIQNLMTSLLENMTYEYLQLRLLYSRDCFFFCVQESRDCYLSCVPLRCALYSIDLLMFVVNAKKTYLYQRYTAICTV